MLPYAIAIFALLLIAVFLARRPRSKQLPPIIDDDNWHVKPLERNQNTIFTDEKHRPTTRGKKSMPPHLVDAAPTGQRWSKQNIWYETEIVGESHYQANIEHFCAGGSNVELTADLVPENDNRHDKNAVRVDIGGRIVGYLSREDAEIYREMLNAGKADTTYHALVRGTPGRRGIYLSLDMRNFE